MSAFTSPLILSPISRKPISSSKLLLGRPFTSDSGRFLGRRRLGCLKREVTSMPSSIRLHSVINGASLEEEEGGEGGGGDEENSSYSSPRFTYSTAGFETTLNRLSKWIVLILFASLLMFRHDGEASWAAIGSIGNSWLSFKLKHFFNQERPFGNLRSDPGMPSSHAQSIFFNLTFAAISLAQYSGVNVITILVSIIILAIGSYLSWLRVSQQLHTASQVTVGAIVGTGFSIVWFRLWDLVIFHAFEANLWVRFLTLFSAVGICLGFIGYVIMYWIKPEIEPDV